MVKNNHHDHRSSFCCNSVVSVDRNAHLSDRLGFTGDQGSMRITCGRLQSGRLFRPLVVRVGSDFVGGRLRTLRSGVRAGQSIRETAAGPILAEQRTVRHRKFAERRTERGFHAGPVDAQITRPTAGRANGK